MDENECQPKNDTEINARAVIVSTGCASFYYVVSMTYLYYSVGVITGVGFCLMYCPPINMVTMYFKKYRSLATGIALCGGGVGDVIFSKFFAWLIKEFEWKNTFLIYAGLFIFCSLVLINAIHFIGFWEEPFGNRKKRTFNSNPSREIPMMTKELKGGKEEWNFQRGEGWKCLGIPYENRKAWLYVLLSEANDGLSALIKKLDYLLIEKCTERFASVRQILLNYSNPFRRKTGKMEEFGITEIFSDNANLSGMLGRPAKVEKAIHKAVIKIDEKGTEASAATGSLMVARCGPSLFYATHPFCILLLQLKEMIQLNQKISFLWALFVNLFLPTVIFFQ